MLEPTAAVAGLRRAVLMDVSFCHAAVQVGVGLGVPVAEDVSVAVAVGVAVGVPPPAQLYRTFNPLMSVDVPQEKVVAGPPEPACTPLVSSLPLSFVAPPKNKKMEGPAEVRGERMRG